MAKKKKNKPSAPPAAAPEPFTMPLGLLSRTVRSMEMLSEQWDDMRGVQVYRDTRTVVAPIYPAKKQNGERAEFAGHDKAWKLFLAVWEAKELGIDRDELFRRLWPNTDGSEPANASNPDKQKQKCNRLLEPLRIEIRADNRGVWRLANI